MKYSLGLHIVLNNTGKLAAVKNLLPLKEDNNVWPDEYKLVEGKDDDDNDYLLVEIRFNNIEERSGVLNSIKGIEGILHQCLPGSFIRQHKCYHDEEDSRKCEVETIEV